MGVPSLVKIKKRVVATASVKNVLQGDCFWPFRGEVSKYEDILVSINTCRSYRTNQVDRNSVERFTDAR